MNLTEIPQDDKRPELLKIIQQLLVALVAVAFISLAGVFVLYNQPFFQRQLSKMEQRKEVARMPLAEVENVAPATGTPDYFDPANFDTTLIKNAVEASFIRYGEQLMTETPRYLGPEVKDPSHRFSGNNLACNNCHLNGGTRPYAAPYVGVWGTYPAFRGRSNTIGTLEDRINGCMERSMNGKPLPVESREMKAMLAYIKFLNRHVPTGEKVKGQGFATIQAPARAADPKHGGEVFVQYCVTCHGKDGQGKRKGSVGDAQGYLYPPLWGPDSFNDGAGMHRLLTAARFIKANMPFGVAVGEPVLSDEEAYDVAAYINSFPRPVKAHKEKDYPDLKRKPQDCPYPPYADNMPPEQHRLGPYIMN